MKYSVMFDNLRFVLIVPAQSPEDAEMEAIRLALRDWADYLPVNLDFGECKVEEVR